jgi:uncharacterized membrane protein
MAVTEPISKVNLERITNGIYAFTMTLMIRNIQIPQPGVILSKVALEQYLDTTILAIFDFAGAYLILGMFWLFYFQIFHRMKTFDYKFLYIHLFSLMIVVFVPFTQGFTAQSPTASIADILFQVNYLALSILLVVAWYYARSHPSLLVPEMTGAEASFLAKKFLVPLTVAIIGIAMVMTGFPYIDLLYLLPFVIIGLFFRQPPEETPKMHN